jgi:hypothetical protein
LTEVCSPSPVQAEKDLDERLSAMKVMLIGEVRGALRMRRVHARAG